MNRIAKLSQQDRRFVFLTSSKKTGKSVVKFNLLQLDYC